MMTKTPPMKSLLTLFYASLMTISCFGQKPNPDYDPELAKKVGADERGMKMYVLAILKSGSYVEKDSAKNAQLFAGHFSNMETLAEKGLLIVAGPLDKNDLSYRGIFILNVPTVEEARILVGQDPTVKAGIFDVEYFGWYGSAALSEYMPYDKKLRKSIPE